MIPEIPQVDAVPSYYWNGFGINAGQLCVDPVGAITHFSNGCGFTATGQLATSAGPATNYHNGHGYADGRVIL